MFLCLDPTSLFDFPSLCVPTVSVSRCSSLIFISVCSDILDTSFCCSHLLLCVFRHSRHPILLFAFPFLCSGYFALRINSFSVYSDTRHPILLFAFPFLCSGYFAFRINSFSVYSDTRHPILLFAFPFLCSGILHMLFCFPPLFLFCVFRHSTSHFTVRLCLSLCSGILHTLKQNEAQSARAESTQP